MRWNNHVGLGVKQCNNHARIFCSKLMRCDEIIPLLVKIIIIIAPWEQCTVCRICSVIPDRIEPQHNSDHVQLYRDIVISRFNKCLK